jgi:hypothetical protein
MRYGITCYENPRAFERFALSPQIDHDRDKIIEWIGLIELREVARFEVEAETPEGAAEEGFSIGNAPDEPTDLNGRRWDHKRWRSMSSADVVVVETPDGSIPYFCLSFGWLALPPGTLALPAAAS